MYRSILWYSRPERGLRVVAADLPILKAITQTLQYNTVRAQA